MFITKICQTPYNFFIFLYSQNTKTVVMEYIDKMKLKRSKIKKENKSKQTRLTFKMNISHT